MIGHLIARAIVVGLGGFDGDLGSLIAADAAEVEDGLVDGGARVQDAEGSDEGWDVETEVCGELGEIDTEGLQVDGLVLILQRPFDIRQQRGPSLIGARFGLLQILFGQFDAGAAFGGELPRRYGP